MSLTKQDLQAIKGIVDDVITTRVKPMIEDAVEELRLQTVAGFNEMSAWFAEVDKRFEQVDKRLDRLEARVERIEKRLVYMDKRHQAHDAQFDEHDTRLVHLEKHTGLSPA